MTSRPPPPGREGRRPSPSPSGSGGSGSPSGGLGGSWSPSEVGQPARVAEPGPTALAPIEPLLGAASRSVRVTGPRDLRASGTRWGWLSPAVTATRTQMWMEWRWRRPPRPVCCSVSGSAWRQPGPRGGLLPGLGAPGGGQGSRLRDPSVGSPVVAGVLVFSTLLASGAGQPPCGRRRSAAASSSAGPASLRESRSPQTVAEEPHQVRYGGQWVVLTVNEVHRSGRTYRTRERAGMIVSRCCLPPSQPSQGGVEGRLAVGERLRVRASVGGGAVERLAGLGSRRWCCGIPSSRGGRRRVARRCGSASGCGTRRGAGRWPA